MRPAVACFGEVLWDSLPAGLFPGGAPLNVAVHLAGLNRRVLLISAVGDDFLGRELIRRLAARGVETSGIAHVKDLPTGTVLARLDARGNAGYEIAEKVAWDRIPGPGDSLPPLEAVVFGSLALRSRWNQSTLNTLLHRSEDQTLKVFDVNLRHPFDCLDRVRTWATRADLLKLNQEEAIRLVGHRETPEVLARSVANDFPQAVICLTAGERGAGLLRDGAWVWADAPKIEVADTVGAGDCFLAVLLHHWLRGLNTHEILSRAVQAAAFVASRPGATPPLPAELCF